MKNESTFQALLLAAIVLILVLMWIHPFPAGSDVYLGIGFGAVCTLFKQLGSSNKNDTPKEEAKP